VAYRFGAANTDDATWTESASPWGATQRSGVIAGWFYPTALTAGNALWSVGGVNRAVVAATTSEIDLWLDRTTDTQWRTSGLNLAIGQWHFIAVALNNFNTGTVTTFKVWRSVGTDIPTPVTVAVVGAGSGNAVGGTIVSIGNLSATGTSSFVGDIGRFDYFVATLANAFIDNTNGTIDVEQERRAFENVVIPIWQGRFPTFLNSGQNSNNGITHVVADLDQGSYARSVRNGGTTITMDRGIAIAGATVSQNRSPIATVGPVAWPNSLRR
jgi:hypothetical protein